MKISIKPNRAVVTIGVDYPEGPGVTVSAVGLDQVETTLQRVLDLPSKELGSLRNWLAFEREVGDFWEVSDADEDTVASVVLV